METPLSHDAVLARLRSLLGDVLLLPPEEIPDGAGIMGELGAESIDLLDLRFRIEREFSIRYTHEDLIASVHPQATPDRFRSEFTVLTLARHIAGRIHAGA